MSLTRILGALDAQVTPSAEPLLPGNHIIYAICGRKVCLVHIFIVTSLADGSQRDIAS